MLGSCLGKSGLWLERGGRHPTGGGEEGEHQGAKDGSADDFFKLLLHDGTCLGLGCGEASADANV